MNSTSTDSGPSPDEALSGSLTETPNENLASEDDIAEATDLVASTPKTLPLKKAKSPLFVPAILPEETPLSQDIDAAPAESAHEEAPVASIGEGVGEAQLEPSSPEPEPPLPSVEFFPPPDVPYSASVTLELRCSEPGASIHYALDAEDVTENDAVYDPADKILLIKSTSIAARAYVEGKPGPVALGHYEVAKPTWQKLEPLEQVDPTPHEQKDEASLEGSWRLAAASVRGRLHAHRGGWREDAFRHGLAHASDGTYSIVVVSDGAGSASLSRVASNLACQEALDSLRAALNQTLPLENETQALIQHNLPTLRTLLVDAARAALQKVRDEANQRNRPLADFSATLLILVRREWRGQQLCAALQAGDGGIALWSDDGALTLLGEADHGQQSGETRFLTSNNMENEFPARVKFTIKPNLRAVAVMSDGVADDFFPEAERLPELFKTVLPLVEKNPVSDAGDTLLSWIDYEKKGSSDDRTLVVCWRSSASSPELEDSHGQL